MSVKDQEWIVNEFCLVKTTLRSAKQNLCICGSFGSTLRMWYVRDVNEINLCQLVVVGGGGGGGGAGGCWAGC